MAHDVRVGLADGDPVDDSGEFACRDLAVHGGRAVAELGGADGEVEAAVRQQGGSRVGDMAAGRPPASSTRRRPDASYF